MNNYVHKVWNDIFKILHQSAFFKSDKHYTIIGAGNSSVPCQDTIKSFNDARKSKDVAEITSGYLKSDGCNSYVDVYEHRNQLMMQQKPRQPCGKSNTDDEYTLISTKYKPDKTISVNTI